jgi:protein subunit release factor A
LTLHNLDRVMQGDLDEIVTQLVAHERQQQLESGAGSTSK